MTDRHRSSGSGAAEAASQDSESTADRLLAHVPLFRDIDADARARIGTSCRVHRFVEHEQIIDRDAATTDVYFVISGRVRIVNYSLTGREITFDELSAGGYFGEIAAIDGQPRSASVVAIADSVLVGMPRQAFVNAVARHPPIALTVMERLTQMVRHADERIMDLTTLAAHNRVHNELLRLSRAGSVQGNTVRIAPAPKQVDIASLAGTTRETVGRVISELGRDGIVKRGKGALLILDRARLARLVERVRG